jgi:hypothetical protein
LTEIGWDEPGSHARRASYLSGGLVDREQGTITKDWGGRFPVALIYPNSYCVGMSNLGFQSIYKLINSYRDCVCELSPFPTNWIT